MINAKRSRRNEGYSEDSDVVRHHDFMIPSLMRVFQYFWLDVLSVGLLLSASSLSAVKLHIYSVILFADQ